MTMLEWFGAFAVALIFSSVYLVLFYLVINFFANREKGKSQKPIMVIFSYFLIIILFFVPGILFVMLYL